MAEHENEALQIEQALDTFAQIEAPEVCWLGGHDRDVDQADDFCRGCAETMVAVGAADFVDGGWGTREHDSCRHCECCGRVLRYTLTVEGVGSEIEHFSQCPPAQYFDDDVAFHIARLVESAPNDPEALAIGRAAANVASGML